MSVSFIQAVKAASLGATKDKTLPSLCAVVVDSVKRIVYATDRYRIVVAQYDVNIPSTTSEPFTISSDGVKRLVAVKLGSGWPSDIVTGFDVRDYRVNVGLVDSSTVSVEQGQEGFPYGVLRLFPSELPASVDAAAYSFNPELFGVVASVAKCLKSSTRDTLSAVEYGTVPGKPRLFSISLDGDMVAWILAMPTTGSVPADFVGRDTLPVYPWM